MHKTLIQITEEQYEKIRQISYKEHKSIAEIIRNAIDGYLKENEKNN